MTASYRNFDDIMYRPTLAEDNCPVSQK